MLFPPPTSSSTGRRVVATGAGIVTALGVGWNPNADGFRRGRTAHRPVHLFDVSRQRVKTAGVVELPGVLPASRLRGAQIRRLDRAGRLLLLAALEAWQPSRGQMSESIPVVLGTTSGGMSLGETFYRNAIGTPTSRRGQPTRVVHYQAQQQALAMMAALGIRGPLTLVANACASGANAIGHAFDLVRLGRADRVLAGGYDALSQLVFAGFDSLQALSPTTCRPFDAHRDGLALGEGAGVVVLEDLDYARDRRAAILGEVTGYGAGTDSHHLTQPHPEGDAAFSTMTDACRQSGIGPGEIGYLNAHGTGTPLNDSAEAAAINRWAQGHQVPVSSTKAGIGHLLGAAGAVEAIVCLMALRGQWLPPTANVRTPDPACAFPVVTSAAEGRIEYALTNSFGFGGANASLVLRRWS